MPKRTSLFGQVLAAQQPIILIRSGPERALKGNDARQISHQQTAGPDDHSVRKLDGKLGTRLQKRLDALLSSHLAGLLPEEKRYFVLVPLTGVAAGLLAVLFFYLLALIQSVWYQAGGGDSFLTAVGRTPSPLRWLIPMAGGVLVAIVAWLLGPARRAEGTAGLIETLAVGKGELSLRRTVTTSLVSLVAVGSGASLGREGALIQSGAAFASWLGRTLHLQEHHVKVLLACGAAGGIAASYNVPIGASVFAMEVLLGSFALELFGPIILASVIATAVSRNFVLGNFPAYTVPPYQLSEDPTIDLLVAVFLGITLGAVSAFFIKVLSSTGQLLAGARRWDPVKPVLVMAALGVSAFVFPELLGNGFDTVNAVLRGETAQPVHILLLLCAAKILATALCRAARIPGGLFTPSLFVGALVGAAFAIVLEKTVGGGTAPTAKYALLGMGAILAGTIKAPITAVLIVFELTRSYSVILPLMAACLASTLVSHFLRRDSIFTAPLRSKGIFVPMALTPTWMHQPRIDSIVDDSVETVSAAQPFDDVIDQFLRSPLEHDRLYVVDAENRYLGVISLHEIKLFLRERGNFESVIAADVVDASFPCVACDAPLSRAIEIFTQTHAERLPVVEDMTSLRILGSISKRDILEAYRKRNLARAPDED